MTFLFYHSRHSLVQGVVTDSTNLLAKLRPAPCASLWFVIALQVLSCEPASGEWVAVEKTQSGITTVYVELNSIRRTEQMVRMWHVIDFKTVQSYLGYSVLSVRAQGQYDCVDERTRTLTETGFSGNMAGGAVVYTYPEAGRWQPIAPRTIAHALFQVACSKQ